MYIIKNTNNILFCFDFEIPHSIDFILNLNIDGLNYIDIKFLFLFLLFKFNFD